MRRLAAARRAGLPSKPKPASPARPRLLGLELGSSKILWNFGAGSGNRTRVSSLEGWRTTIVRYPRCEPASRAKPRGVVRSGLVVGRGYRGRRHLRSPAFRHGFHFSVAQASPGVAAEHPAQRQEGSAHGAPFQQDLPGVRGARRLMPAEAVRVQVLQRAVVRRERTLIAGDDACQKPGEGRWHADMIADHGSAR